MAFHYGGRGFKCVVARPFNHIGPGQNPGFLVPDAAQQIIACEKGGQSEISVGNLDAKRDYTDVRDIVRAYRLLLEKGKGGEIYNICSGKSVSGHDIVDGLIEGRRLPGAAKTGSGAHAPVRQPRYLRRQLQTCRSYRLEAGNHPGRLPWQTSSPTGAAVRINRPYRAGI